MTGDAKNLLKKTFGFSSFRPHQEDIVAAILDHRDVFAALPTGGGKSLCYQLPSLLLPNLTVVVSPLIALMEDQVTAARQMGIPASYLNSTLGEEEARSLYREIHAGVIKLLYVSPERLSQPRFREALHGWGVSLFAIDEAHCISEWGHEFRPEYRNLTVLRSEFPDATLAAFTATATPRVQNDVVSLLSLRDAHLVRGNFDRREIFYRVARKERVNRQIHDFIVRHSDEPGIVYRATRRSVDDTAAFLENHGVSALPYHAGLSDGNRRSNQAAFVRDEVQVIVATIAFGMGIDKSNVRWVVHGDLPRSVEAYYQETGRAGRDGEDADTCLFYAPADIAKIRYHIDRMEVDREREQAEENLKEVLRFVDSTVCRRTQLLRHFGQQHDGTCNRCDVCTTTSTMEDCTREAQMVMSAMVRTGERFGTHHVIDVVTGTTGDRIQRLGHDGLPTFGVGADRSRSWWIRLTADMEAANLVERRDGERSGLRLTRRGKDVLSGREHFRRLHREESVQRGGTDRRSTPSPSGSADASDAAATLAEEEGDALFLCLKKLRLRLAREGSLPPYLIFSDRTLRSMVQLCPQERRQLLAVRGVGERKADRYGDAFLERIRGFLATGSCPD